MRLEFKNPILKMDYELSLRCKGTPMGASSKAWNVNKAEEEKIVLSIPFGYLSSLCEIAEDYEDTQGHEAPIDLTYKTVKNLPTVLGYQYFAYTVSGSFTKEKTIEILKKTLASYLMILCMNEHLCKPTLIKKKDFDAIIAMLPSDEATPINSWMGFSIQTGIKQKCDLLDVVDNAVKITANGILRIRFSRVIEAYKSMCGVDLAAYGLEDFEASCE